MLAWLNAGWFYSIFLGMQSIFYLLAVTGWVFANRNIKLKLLYIPYYFLFMNLSVFLGFFRFLQKRQTVLWEKAARQNTAWLFLNTRKRIFFKWKIVGPLNGWLTKINLRRFGLLKFVIIFTRHSSLQPLWNLPRSSRLHCGTTSLKFPKNLKINTVNPLAIL